MRKGFLLFRWANLLAAIVAARFHLFMPRAELFGTANPAIYTVSCQTPRRSWPGVDPSEDETVLTNYR